MLGAHKRHPRLSPSLPLFTPKNTTNPARNHDNLHTMARTKARNVLLSINVFACTTKKGGRKKFNCWGYRTASTVLPMVANPLPFNQLAPNGTLRNTLPTVEHRPSLYQKSSDPHQRRPKARFKDQGHVQLNKVAPARGSEAVGRNVGKRSRFRGIRGGQPRRLV